MIPFISIEAQINLLSVDFIPDSIRKNAKSVIRDNTITFELIDMNNCKIHDTRSITVFDKEGESHLNTSFFYSSKFLINQISITIYDKAGTKIRSIGKRDMIDRSADPYGTMYSDLRFLDLTTTTSNDYPYTLKYDLVYLVKYSFHFPDWEPVENYDQSIQQSSFEIIVPEGYNFQYKQTGLICEPEKSSVNGKQICKWKIKNIPAVKYEAFAPAEIIGMPKVLISPSDFSFDEYSGNMSTWKDFGRFMDTLIEGRNDISEELKLKVRDMTAGTNDPVEKIRILYKYLQNTTRYVSIQVGIGGYQPFPASSVEKNGYGDCKALSNYMVTLLAAAGIKAYCSLIRAGKFQYSMDTSFVHSPFNHVIVFVPLQDDDLWLECTSQIHPFGFLGDFTDDRWALVITENGGALRKTRDYSGLSKKVCNASIKLGNDPNASAIVKTHYTGLYYSNILPFLHFDYEKKKDYLYDYHAYYDHHLDIPDFKISSFSYSDSADIFPKAFESLVLDLINYTSISGSRMFVPLKLSDRSTDIPRKDAERINPISIKRETCEYDSICIQIPEGYSIEFLPGNDSIKSCFGEMSVSISVDENKVYYVRSLMVYRKTHSKENYEEFSRFCKYINKLDNLKMVLIKNT
jgi:hypothetical protein